MSTHPEETPPILAPAPIGRLPVALIDSFALKANWRSMAMQAGRARTGAAVKADGYGLGATMVAKALFAAGCRDFFVAWAEEGVELRTALTGKNCRIFVLQGLDEHASALCRLHLLIPVLSTTDDIAVWRATARSGLPGVSALQFDTGMNRLGLNADEARAAARLARDGSLDLALVMSHLASSDTPESDQNKEQLARFRQMCALFPHVAQSFANSGGILMGADYHFDLTRPGISLYGGAVSLAPAGTIRPVAALYGHVIQVHTAEAGEAAGYGGAARLTRATRIATVGLGYADGYPRSAGGLGGKRHSDRPADVIVAGHRCPILGRVSMDSTLVDVTDIAADDARPGTAVEFFGPNMPIDEVASVSGTIAYEILTSLGPRVTRRWL